MGFQIRFLTLPEGYPAIVKDQWSFFETASAAQQAGLIRAAEGGEGVRIEIRSISPSHALDPGRLLQTSTTSGWRVAMGSGSSAIAADIYTMQGGDGGGADPESHKLPRLACMRKGPNIAAMMRAIAMIQKNDPRESFDLPGGSFVIGLLNSPELFTDALWLQPETGDSKDLWIVPYHTVISNFPLMRAYREADFLNYVRPIAEKWKFLKKPVLSVERAKGSRYGSGGAPSPP